MLASLPQCPGRAASVGEKFENSQGRYAGRSKAYQENQEKMQLRSDCIKMTLVASCVKQHLLAAMTNSAFAPFSTACFIKLWESEPGVIWAGLCS